MEYLKMLEGVKTLFVTCRQWGDTGKGKIVDLFAEWADIIVRATGGDNAGHSVVHGDKELVTHLIPSGILYDSEGKINVMGSGMVIYPRSLSKELAKLREMGLSYSNLCLACNAKLITPAEIVMDRISESTAGKGKIGSTGKGIGPAYTDFVGRQGLLVQDLINPEFFREKLERHLKNKALTLGNYDLDLIKKIMGHEDLESGLYFNYIEPEKIFDIDAIYEKYLEYGRELKPLMGDTDSWIRSQLESRIGRKKILVEGAQGDLLSIKRGTYPFVTSSDCTVAGLAEGAGLRESDADLSLGIIKGFYMTRVGNGPFPTELGGQKSDDWCNGGGGSREVEKNYSRDVNNQNEFLQGVALRKVGQEYGATTGRPRRVGWLDLPLLRYALSFNSPDIILTKLDVLNDCKTIKICDYYRYDGPVYYIDCHQKIKSGALIHTAIPAAEVLKHCRPVYVEFPGWQKSLKECSSFGDLPPELKNILIFITSQTGIKPRIISIGPDRDETIFIE